MFNYFLKYDQDGYLVSPLWQSLAPYPFIIKLALGFILVSTIMIIYVQISLAVVRYRGARKMRREEKLYPIIDELITEHIIIEAQINDDPNYQLDVTPFEIPVFENSTNRQILLDRIINYKRNFSGKAADLLKQLYINLELDKISFRKLKSRKWNVVIVGLKELTNMDVNISDVNILPFTNSSNIELRAEARNAYIKLSKNEPFKFFDISKEPLLAWDQVELFKTITTTKNIAIPNFARWITYSSNKSVISFCLKLVNHYNQEEAAPAVMNLLDNKDHLLRAEAINCLGKLKYVQAEQKMLSIYSNQPLNCQLETLKALGRMEVGTHDQFFRHEFLYNTDFDVRKNAAKSLVRTASNEVIEDLLHSSSEENRIIIKHSLNPLIKY